MRSLPLIPIAVIVASAFARVTFADPPALTLEQAQAEAQQRAPERAVADANVVAAETRGAVAGRRFTHDPVLIGRYQQPPPGGDADDRAWSVGLEWTLDVSGSWRPRRAAARATVTAASEARASALVELNADVAVTFAELADAQRRGTRSARMVTLRELAAGAAERVRTSGEGNQLDVDAATLDLRAAQVAAATDRGDLAAARARLTRLLGRRDATGINVADFLETIAVPSPALIDVLVERNARVKLASAEFEAARLAADAEQKSARPDVTLGLEVGRNHHDIPAAAFVSAPALTGSWNEWEIALQVSVPLPLFERNRVARAGTRADVFGSEAQLARVRADVRANVVEAQARLAAALDAANAAADVPQIVERESQLLEKALRAGGVELAAFAQQAHRLVEVGRVYDDAVLALRRAQAAWVRLAIH